MNDDNQSKQEENLPGKEEQKIPVSQPTPSPTTQPQQPMEVHHHGHVHEKKKWKEYAFQFGMLFLAVALGFVVEKFREHQVDKDMEEKYISSLMTDVRNDRLLIAELADSLFIQTKKIDELQTRFAELETAPDKESVIARCYELRLYVATFYPVNFNQTTITSLLSSGNLRLINKDAASNILLYYNGIKNVEEQKKLYHEYINKCLESMYNIYDIAVSRSRIVGDSLIPPTKIGNHFLTTDPRELNRFNANMERAKTSAFFLINKIGQISDAGQELLDLLQEEYHL